jgi:hypothetical protein
VDAALRRLPADKRPDIDKELRASIADAVDDRVGAGTDPAQAEVAVLTDLGDPARLAAGYADQPLHLIGPDLFLDYLRFLRVMLVMVVPIVAVVVALVQSVSGASVVSVIGATVGTTITTGVHICFWTTLLFALLERTRTVRGPLSGKWTPAMLAEPPSRRVRYGELIAESVATVLFGALILLVPSLRFQTDAAGDPISFLSPWLWESGVVYVFLGLVVLSLGISFANYYARWNTPLAVAATLVKLASPVLLIWLAANDRIVNPAFVAAAGWDPGTVDWIHNGLIIAGALTIIQSIVEGIRRLSSRR